MSSFDPNNSEEDEWLTSLSSNSTGGGNKKKGGKKGKTKKISNRIGKEEIVEAEEVEVDIEVLNDEMADMAVARDLQIALDRDLYHKNKNKEHAFWSTQPVPEINSVFDGRVGDAGPIDPNSDVTTIMTDNHELPKGFVPSGFEWCSVDVTKKEEIDDLYTLLNENYVEDDDCNFRFDYSIPFLQWALTPPGYYMDWHVGIRNKFNGKLHAFISGVPVQVKVHTQVITVCEINFLCCHKSLRDKRLAPTLIKEITRRVNLKGIWQAVYTAGVVLPKPVARCRYWHRSINIKKLVETGFSRLHPRETMNRAIKKHKVPDITSYPLDRLKKEDVPSANRLLTKYLKKTKLHQVMTDDEFAHQLLPKEGVVDCYVLRDQKSGEVTDMISFYHLPSSVLQNELHNRLEIVYFYYNVATTVSLPDLLKDLLIIARQRKVDVCNALELMDNEPHFESLGFKQGDGHLQYYVYNWKCPIMEKKDVGLVLL